MCADATQQSHCKVRVGIQKKKIKSETTLSHVIGFANRTVLPITTRDDSSIVNSSRITKYRRGNLAPFTDGSCSSCVGDFIAIAVRELDK